MLTLMVPSCELEMVLYEGDEIQYQAVAASIRHTYCGKYMDGALPPPAET